MENPSGAATANVPSFQPFFLFSEENFNLVFRRQNWRFWDSGKIEEKTSFFAGTYFWYDYDDVEFSQKFHLLHFSKTDFTFTSFMWQHIIVGIRISNSRVANHRKKDERECH